MAKLTGRAFITVGGKRLASKPGAKGSYGNFERKAELGDQGVLGYKEAPTVPYIECTIAHDANTSLAELAAMTNVLASFDTDSGRSYVYRNAWTANALEISGGDVSLRIEAMSCEEV